MAMIILGIDPGLKCGLAVIGGSQAIVDDAPVIKDGKRSSINGAALADLIDSWNIDAAVIERVHSMPKQGVASSFTFGRAFGTVEGVIEALKIPTTYVTPQSWKKFYGISSDKEAARARAIQLFPALASSLKRKKDVDRAEALLIANYHQQATIDGRAA